LPEPGTVNPERRKGTPEGPITASDWSPERLSERIRSELSPHAWERLIRATNRRGATLEQLLLGLSEVA